MKRQGTTPSGSIIRFVSRNRQVILHCGARQHTFKLSKGWKYLLHILSQPGQSVTATQLLSQGNSIPAHYGHLARLSEVHLATMQLYTFDLEQPLPLCDRQTIGQVCARMNYLLQKEAELMEYCDLAALEELREEKEQLQHYLSEVLNSRGRIRSSRDKARRDIHSVYVAIGRAIREIAAVEPELGGYLAKHIQAWGRVCYNPGELELCIENQ